MTRIVKEMFNDPYAYALFVLCYGVTPLNTLLGAGIIHLAITGRTDSALNALHGVTVLVIAGLVWRFVQERLSMRVLITILGVWSAVGCYALAFWLLTPVPHMFLAVPAACYGLVVLTGYRLFIRSGGSHAG